MVAPRRTRRSGSDPVTTRTPRRCVKPCHGCPSAVRIEEPGEAPYRSVTVTVTCPAGRSRSVQCGTMRRLFLLTALVCGVTVVAARQVPSIVNTNTVPGGMDAPPMTAAQALATMKLPAGFKASVFASEPDVQNPIQLTWDTHGRLWVAENYTMDS